MDFSQACQKWSKDDDHLRLITQTVGPLPKEVIEEGTTARKFYSGEKLKKLNEGDIQTTSIVKQLVLRKTWLQFSDVQAFSRWLELLLNPDPRARTTAYQSAKHSFLEHGREKRKVENIERSLYKPEGRRSKPSHYLSDSSLSQDITTFDFHDSLSSLQLPSLAAESSKNPSDG